ncbi:MAG TPA: hypothetical protein VHM28_07515, partial [Anaerolineales bacterium]|nr:hypothetical protein [Anaerolineales bacterium]
MDDRSLFKDLRFLIAATLMLAFCIIVPVLRLQSDSQTATTLSDGASVLSALIASIFFVGVWSSTSLRDSSGRIWGLIAIGMIEWTVAEALWGYYEVVLGQEVPYPSVADFFWLSGYVFIFIALLLQYRVFRAAPTRRQWLTILFVIVLFSVIGGLLVIQPIIAQFDPEAVLEDVFNIAYPLFDLILLILTMAIIFLVEQGRFGFSWRLLGLGFIVMAAADLLFSYSTSIGIYFPDGQLNGITLTIDTLYYLGYLMQGLGGYTYLLLIGSLQAGKMNIVVRQPAKENILVFINQQGNIISVSDNFSS